MLGFNIHCTMDRASINTLAIATLAGATASAVTYYSLCRQQVEGDAPPVTFSPTPPPKKKEEASPKPDTKTAERKSKAQTHMESWDSINRYSGAILELPLLPIEIEVAAESTRVTEDVKEGLDNYSDELTNATNWDGGAYAAVCNHVRKRLGGNKSRDWLVKTSHYGHDLKAHPHRELKIEVNIALGKAVFDLCEKDGGLLPRLKQNPHEVVLLLDAPSWGSTRAIAKACGEDLLRCNQVVIPQADLQQYFMMVNDREVSVGVKAQRLDHWLCTHNESNTRVIAAFLDYECRIMGRHSEALCPMADIMRYFRFGYPADDSVLAITVGTWPYKDEPLKSVAEVVAAIEDEAKANNYEVQLLKKWEYRMVTLLYRVRRID